MSEANDLLRRALEAWDSKEEPYFERLHHVFEEIRTYLANQETAKDEPVAWGVFEGKLHDCFYSKEEAIEMAGYKGDHAVVAPLYANPQESKKPMTEEEIPYHENRDYPAFYLGIRFAEKHHGIGEKE